jgi:hypothetical protein
VVQTDALVGEPRNFGPGFKIVEVEPINDEAGAYVRFAGPTLTDELKYGEPIFRPIGAETVTAATVGATVIAPWSTTLAVGAPANNDSCTVASVVGLSPEDEVRITMNGSYGVHVARVKEIGGYLGPNRFTFVPRIPYNADAGKAVQFRKRKVQIAEQGLKGAFVVGTEVHVVLDNLSTHYTTIADDPEEDSGNVIITLDKGVPSQASVGKAVNAYDYSTPATDDVAQIMYYKPDWDVRFDDLSYEGTEAGTFHAPTGDSVYDLLQATAAASGEFWRMTYGSAYGFADRRIEWRRTAPVAGANNPLRLVMPDQGSIDSLAANIDRAIITGTVRPKATADPVTRVYPFAGDNRVSLALATADAIAYANSYGYTVVLPPENAVYGQPYIKDSLLEANPKFGVRARSANFSTVRANVPKIPELQAAADELVALAVNWLLERRNNRTFYDVDGVVSAVSIRPGDRVELYYQDPSSAWTIERLGAQSLYVLEVTKTYDATGEGALNGVPLYSVRLSDGPEMMPSTQRTMAGLARDTERLVRTTGGAGTLSAVSVGSVTIVEGQNDHLPASSGNAAIEVPLVEQTVSLRLAGPSGLEIAATGLRLADTVAGDGLAISNKVLSIGVAGNSGLVTGADSLALGTPGALSSASVSAVAGSGHTHAMVAASNAKAAPGQLVKSDVSGDSIWRWLTADKLVAPLIESLGSIRLDPANSLITADGNLSFVGARQINTDTGSLTLAPAAGLILDPADDVVQISGGSTVRTAHWSSGFLGTGWGVTYSGEGDFRKLTADELHVAAFIADTARVKVGAEYVTPSMAIVARNFVIPAVNGSGTLYVEDAPGFNEVPVFADGDWLLLRVVDRAAGGLNVTNAWGQVSGYVGLPDGEQSWTFACKSTSSAGQVAPAGATALDFGKSGDGWWWTTTLDPAGAPYAGISTWQGNNPYQDSNRRHQLRLGQLRGVSGVYEWGLQAGVSSSSFVRFSDLHSEIHGSQLSLYAGDDAQLRLVAATVYFYRTSSALDQLVTNQDHNSEGVVSTHGSYWQTVDEGVGTPNYTDYIANQRNRSGFATMGLTSPGSFSAPIYRVSLATVVQGVGFANDGVALYAQVMAADEVTPLTAEMQVALRESDGVTAATVQLPHDERATWTQWTGARLRLRWEYEIGGNREAIRLDPQVPSIAVGDPLPTSMNFGGAGLWVGRESGVYQLRLGRPVGVGLRWNGVTLSIRGDNDADVIKFDSGGNSSFEGVMKIGAGGEIRQGSGTEGSTGVWGASWGSYTGLRIGREGGVGRLATYSGGTVQVQLDTTGTLLAGAGNVRLNSSGVSLLGITVSSVGQIAISDKAKSIWFNSGATDIGYVSSAYYAGSNWRALQLSLNGNSNYLQVASDRITLNASQVTVGSASSPGTVTVQGGVTLANGGLSLSTGGVVAALGGSFGSYVTAPGLVMGNISGGQPRAVVFEALTSHPSISNLFNNDVQLYVLKVGSVSKLYMQNAAGTRVQVATF